MSKPNSRELQSVASLLMHTMCVAGIFDDYDECLADIETLPELADFHAEVMIGVEFINQYSNHELNADDWQKTYDAEIVHRKS